MYIDPLLIGNNNHNKVVIVITNQFKCTIYHKLFNYHDYQM